MKILLPFLLVCSFALTSAAENLSSFCKGRFLGKGKYTIGKVEQKYEVYYTFHRNKLRADFTSIGGPFSMELSFLFFDDGWFLIYHQGKFAGNGECYAAICNFNFKAGGAEYRNTLYLFDEKYINIGQKDENGKKTYWKDNASRLPDLKNA